MSEPLVELRWIRLREDWTLQYRCRAIEINTFTREVRMNEEWTPWISVPFMAPDE